MEGSERFIADTPKRAYLDVPDTHVMVTKVNALKGESDERINTLREAIAKDESMQKLFSIIRDGWPDNKNELRSELRPYFDVRDTLSHQDGVILKGERIVFPKSLRDITKTRLRSSHQGYDSMMRRARNTVFWPAMSHKIRQVAENSETCQLNKPRNQKETLKNMKKGKSRGAKFVSICLK